MSFTEQQIREKAYELWIARGSRPGFAMQDWADAEKLIAQASAPAPAVAPAPIAAEPAKASGKGKNKSSSAAPAASGGEDDVKYGLKKMS